MPSLIELLEAFEESTRKGTEWERLSVVMGLTKTNCCRNSGCMSAPAGCTIAGTPA